MMIHITGTALKGSGSFDEISLLDTKQDAQTSKASYIFQKIKDAGHYIQEHPKEVAKGLSLAVAIGGTATGTILLPLGYIVAGSIAGGSGTLGFTTYKILTTGKKED